jgi:hypothetical protein
MNASAPPEAETRPGLPAGAGAGRWDSIRRADAIVISIPKSGRTWLRVFFQAYRTGAVPERFTLAGVRDHHLPPPAVHLGHERWAHRTTRSFKEYLLRDHLLPAGLLHHKPVTLLARDPRDVVVSLYFAETRRHPRFTEDRRRAQPVFLRALDEIFVRAAGRDFFRGSVADFIRSPLFGIRAIVQVMNGWLERFAGLPRFRLLRYEDLRADPLKHFRDLLVFSGVGDVDEALLARAVAFASFENMRRLEESGAFGHRLRPADAADPESYKVRRGKVGGYVDYLTPADVAFLQTEMYRLDPRFGYDTTTFAPERRDP